MSGGMATVERSWALLDPDTPRSDRDPEARAAAAPDDSFARHPLTPENTGLPLSGSPPTRGIPWLGWRERYLISADRADEGGPRGHGSPATRGSRRWSPGAGSWKLRTPGLYTLSELRPETSLTCEIQTFIGGG